MNFFNSPFLILAWRFLLSKKSENFLSFIAWVSVGGVAIGVMALTLVMSVMNGFDRELARIITETNGDLVLYSRSEPISHPDLVEQEIRKIIPSVQAISPSFVMEMMASGPGGVSGSVLQGFDPILLGEVTQIPKRIIQGRLPQKEKEVAVGVDLGKKLGAQVGSKIRLIVPFMGNELEGASSLKVEVVGIVQTGMHDYDSKLIFMLLPDMQTFLSRPKQITHFNIRLKVGAPSRQFSNQLNQYFGYPFRAKDWSQMNQNLFYAIELEKTVIAIILTVIIIVAAFNVVSTLMMMIFDKTKEIAILKAIGFQSSHVFWLFCSIGLGIGGVGILAGIGFALLLAWILSHTRWIELSADIYSISFLPVFVHSSEVLRIAGGAWLICFFATLYPAWKISRQLPSEGLRYES